MMKSFKTISKYDKRISSKLNAPLQEENSLKILSKSHMCEIYIDITFSFDIYY
jgi:hypothetical protein